MLAPLERLLHRTLAENRQLTSGGTDDDVAVVQLVWDIGEQDRMRAQLGSQRAGTLERTVGDDDPLNALLVQVTRDQGDGFASADQQCLTALQITENLPSQADCGKRYGNRVFADRGIGTHGLCRTEGRLEQPTKQRADAAGLPCDGIGRLHLTKNLRLAQYQRIQPGGDPHHVAHGLIVDMHIGARLEFIEAESVIAGQPSEYGFGLDLILLQIQLATIAGGEDRRFAGGRHAAQLPQGLDHLVGREGYALADVHRSGLVINAKREESHAESLIR